MELSKLDLALLMALIGEQSPYESQTKLKDKVKYYQNIGGCGAVSEFVINAVNTSDIDTYHSHQLWDKFQKFAKQLNATPHHVYEYLVVYLDYDGNHRVSRNYYTCEEEFDSQNTTSKFVSIIGTTKRLRNKETPVKTIKLVAEG